MRILLATDGSEDAAHALTLVATTPWPTGTMIRVVAVLEEIQDLFGTEWMPVAPTDTAPYELAWKTELQGTLDDAQARLYEAGLTAEGRLLRGRPGSRIVAEARAFEADLVVIGSRGLGPFRAMLLGSVSAEVVDHAPCPVLVARGDHFGQTILGDDGSAAARAASDLLVRHPVLAPGATRVVSVAAPPPMALFGLAVVPPEVVDAYAGSFQQLRGFLAETARATADRLRAAGIAAEPEVRDGDAAHVLVEEAKARAVDLLVVATQGRTGLPRLFLGSVARNVLLHAPCSVLVVRPKVSVRGEARDEAVDEASETAPGAERRDRGALALA